jgi:hypothetical protein
MASWPALPIELPSAGTALRRGSSAAGAVSSSVSGASSVGAVAAAAPTSPVWSELAGLLDTLEREHATCARVVYKNSNQHRPMPYWRAFTRAHTAVGRALAALRQL